MQSLDPLRAPFLPGWNLLASVFYKVVLFLSYTQLLSLIPNLSHMLFRLLLEKNMSN